MVAVRRHGAAARLGRLVHVAGRRRRHARVAHVVHVVMRRQMMVRRLVRLEESRMVLMMEPLVLHDEVVAEQRVRAFVDAGKGRRRRDVAQSGRVAREGQYQRRTTATRHFPVTLCALGSANYRNGGSRPHSNTC